MTRPRPRGLLLVCCGAFAAAGPASAAFLDSGTATSGSITTVTVQPPTGTSGTADCVGGLLGVGSTPRISLTWTRSAQVSAGGAAWGQQALVVSGGSELPAATSADLTAASSTADVVGTRTVPGGPVTALQNDTAYTVRLRSTVGGWHSASSGGAQTTVTTPLCP